MSARPATPMRAVRPTLWVSHCAESGSSKLTTRSDLAFVLRAVTEAPALAARWSDYGLKKGARADLQLLPVPSWGEALRLQPAPEKVWFAGRLVAENRTVATLHRR